MLERPHDGPTPLARPVRYGRPPTPDGDRYPVPPRPPARPSIRPRLYAAAAAAVALIVALAVPLAALR